MEEFSGRAYLVYIDTARKHGVDVDAILRDAIVSEQEVRRDSGRRVPWDDIVRLLEGMAAAAGGHEAFARHPMMNFPKVAPDLAAIASAFVTPAAFINFYYRVLSPTFMSNMRSKIEEMGQDQIRIHYSLNDGYQPCPAFFWATIGALEAMPGFLGLPPAHCFRFEISPHHGVYDLSLPPSRTLAARFQRSMLERFLRGSLEVLERDRAELRSAYEGALKQNERISQQARLLRSVGDMGLDLASRRHLHDLADALLRLLHDELGVAASALWLLLTDDEVPASRPRLLRQRGEAAASERLELVHQEQPVGWLQVTWPQAVGHDDERRTLLDSLRPWMALALHHALALGRLQRAELEQQQAEAALVQALERVAAPTVIVGPDGQVSHGNKAGWHLEQDAEQWGKVARKLAGEPVEGVEVTALGEGERRRFLVVMAGRSRLQEVAEEWGLTEAQREVVELIGRGKANKEIAEELGVTVKTAEAHVSAVLKRAGVQSRAELLVKLFQGGKRA